MGFFRRTILRRKLSNPKLGHITGASIRGGARWDGEAGRDRAERASIIRFALQITVSRTFHGLANTPILNVF